MQRKTMSLKRARFFHEENLDRRKRPTALGGKTAFVVERILDLKGKVIKKTMRAETKP